jgi:hypothetical protein
MLFLATIVVTSATGFLFPLKGVTPALAVGVLSLLLTARRSCGRPGSGRLDPVAAADLIHPRQWLISGRLSWKHRCVSRSWRAHH